MFNLLVNSLNQILLLSTNNDHFHRKDLSVKKVLQSELTHDICCVTLSQSNLLIMSDVLGNVVTYQLSLQEGSLSFSIHDSFQIYDDPHGNTIDQEAIQLQVT